MARPTDYTITNYMKDTVREGICVDGGEVHCTRLAEDAADHFNDFVDSEYNIDERYFEIALKVSDWYLIQKEVGRL